jgi:cardiolipin synthase A/B
VWNYQPTMLHTKVMTVDGALGMIGSSNFNRRSMDHDEEVALVVLDTDVIRTFEEHFRDDLRRSERIDPARWANRSSLQRLQEAAMAPIRRYM